LSKSDLRMDAVGTIDELNSTIGWVLATRDSDAKVSRILGPIQTELLTVGAIVASVGAGSDCAAKVKFQAESAERIRRQTSEVTKDLPPLSRFVAPAGCELACRLHIARTVCRRAERAVVRVAELSPDMPGTILQHINCLSDLLFALARMANSERGHPEKTWRGGDWQ